jgi:hypothetical protein
MKSPRNQKRGIEISHWKIGEADEFQAIDAGEDTDIEPAWPEHQGTFDDPGAMKTSESMSDTAAGRVIADTQFDVRRRNVKGNK